MLLALPILATWGCIPELSKDCIDMTNSSSTYLGIAVGAAIGAVISWWIYNRQNKTSLKQDHLLERINELEQKNRQILLKLESFAHHHEELLKKIFMINESILALDKKMQSMSKD
jgi:predicted RNase H-like nuclease (RuvC/YqgF family)